MTIEHQAYPRFERRLERTTRALDKARLRLQTQGQEGWPDHLNLAKIPTDSNAEKILFLKAAAKVAGFVTKTEEKTIPCLEEDIRKTQKRIEEDSGIGEIRKSAQKAVAGKPGLSQEILAKAERFLEELKEVKIRPEKPAETTSDSNNSNFNKPVKKHKRNEEGEGKQRPSDKLGISNLTGREKEILDFLLENPNRNWFTAEIATSVWTKKDGFTEEQAVTNFASALTRLNPKLKDKGKIANTNPWNGKGKRTKACYRFIPEETILTAPPNAPGVTDIDITETASFGNPEEGKKR